MVIAGWKGLVPQLHSLVAPVAFEGFNQRAVDRCIFCGASRAKRAKTENRHMNIASMQLHVYDLMGHCTHIQLLDGICEAICSSHSLPD